MKTDAPMDTTTQRGSPKTRSVPASPNHPQYHGTAIAKAMRYVRTIGQRGVFMPRLVVFSLCCAPGNRCQIENLLYMAVITV